MPPANDWYNTNKSNPYEEDDLHPEQCHLSYPNNGFNSQSHYSDLNLATPFVANTANRNGKMTANKKGIFSGFLSKKRRDDDGFNTRRMENTTTWMYQQVRKYKWIRLYKKSVLQMSFL